MAHDIIMQALEHSLPHNVPLYSRREHVKHFSEIQEAFQHLKKSIAKVTNGDCREQEDDLYPSENSKEKGRVEEVQIVDDSEETKSVKMGISIQDSEHEPSVTKTIQPDEVARQKSMENMTSGNENEDEQDIAKIWPETKSLSIDTKSDNYESESIEGQDGDDVKQNQESYNNFVLEPVSRLEPDNSELTSTPKPGNLLALRNNKDLDPGILTGGHIEFTSTNKPSKLLLAEMEDYNKMCPHPTSSEDWKVVFDNTISQTDNNVYQSADEMDKSNSDASNGNRIVGEDGKNHSLSNPPTPSFSDWLFTPTTKMADNVQPQQ